MASRTGGRTLRLRRKDEQFTAPVQVNGVVVRDKASKPRRRRPGQATGPDQCLQPRAIGFADAARSPSGKQHGFRAQAIEGTDRRLDVLAVVDAPVYKTYARVRPSAPKGPLAFLETRRRMEPCVHRAMYRGDPILGEFQVGDHVATRRLR